MATLIKSNGEITTVVGANKRVLTLEQLQESVGGYFEFAPTYGTENVIVCEDGVRRGLPLNNIASKRAGLILAGDVLFCTDSEIE